MPNEQLIKVSDKISAAGAIAVGPFSVGKVYIASDDALALLGDKFQAATLKKDEKAVPLGSLQLGHIADLRAQKKAADEAKAKATAEAAKAAGDAQASAADTKTTPAAAGSVTGG